MIKYRQMTEREIKNAEDFLKRLDELKSSNWLKRREFEKKQTLENKKRGWKTQIGENIRGLRI